MLGITGHWVSVCCPVLQAEVSQSVITLGPLLTVEGIETDEKWPWYRTLWCIRAAYSTAR